MVANSRLEEWKINVELYKWHVQIKHARITQFLTIQAGIFAGGAYVTEKVILATNIGRPFLTGVVVGVCIIGYHFSVWYDAADKRAAEYLNEVRRYIREIESSDVSTGLSTFTVQYEKLSKGSKSSTATEMEARLFSSAKHLWLLIGIGTFLALLIFITQMVGSRPT